jgi:hypothetical protein
MELDHVFICVKPGAPEADQLREFGLTEGSPNQHPGQGTANRRFFFDNTFLELLYLTDTEAATSSATSPTHLYERLTIVESTTSQFGVCFRPSHPGEAEPAFRYWRYQPAYLPADKSVAIAAHAPLAEPMWFFLTFGGRPASATLDRRQPLLHTAGFREITRVRVVTTAKDLSDAAKAANDVRGVEIYSGDHPLLEIGFDNEKHGLRADFQHTLPLVFNW